MAVDNGTTTLNRPVLWFLVGRNPLWAAFRPVTYDIRLVEVPLHVTDAIPTGYEAQQFARTNRGPEGGSFSPKPQYWR